MRVAQIDSDVIVYKCGFSSQKTMYRFVYNDGSKIDYSEATLVEIKKDLKTRGVTHEAGNLQRLIVPDPVDYALQRVKMLLEAILDKSEADSFKLYLTSADRSNFRFKLATIQEYKGNRKNMKKPVHYEAIREFLLKYFDAEEVYNQEADDAMGIAQMKNLESSIICSIDKDMNMIPGYHYDMDSQEIYVTSDPGHLELTDDRRKLKGGGLKWFYAQMLLGDSADNIPGIPGLGPVAVYSLLNEYNTEDWFRYQVLDCYKKQYGNDWEKCFKEVGNLLYIRRQENEVKFI